MVLVVACRRPLAMHKRYEVSAVVTTHLMSIHGRAIVHSKINNIDGLNNKGKFSEHRALDRMKSLSKQNYIQER